MHRRGHWGIGFVLFFTTVSLAEVSPEIKQELAGIRADLRKAGTLYRQSNLQKSAAILSTVNQRLGILPHDSDVREAAEPLVESLNKARQLLAKQGVTIPHESAMRDPTAMDATLAELVGEQTKAAKRYWRLAFPREQPQMRATDHLLIMGSSLHELQNVAEVAETVRERVTKVLKLPSSGPSIRTWGTTIYVLPTRYDYGEFGRMVENRQLPVEMHGHWRSQEPSAYIVLGPPEEDGLPLETRLGQYLASVLVDSWGDVPAWFADGVGHVVAERLSRRHAQIRGWRSRATRLVPTMTSEKALLSSDLPLESAGIANWAFTRFLMQDSRRSSLLLRALQDGSPFDDTFAAAYGASSEKVCQRWLFRNGGGKKK